MKTSRLSSRQMYRYNTLYSDIYSPLITCTLVHFAVSLPQAIKYGRAYVRDLNRSENCKPGMKRYHYDLTYRVYHESCE